MPVETIAAVLRRRALAYGDRELYRFIAEPEAVPAMRSYAQMAQAAQRVADALLRVGAPGTRVLIVLPAGVEFLDAFFGCTFAAMVAVPAFPPTASTRANAWTRTCAMVESCEPAVVLTSRKLIVHRATAEAMVPQLARATWICVDELPASNGPSAIVEPGLEEVALLQYTSGSVGEPKGVMVTQRNLVANQLAIAGVVRQDERCIGLTWLPPQHDMGLLGTLIHPVFVGGSTVIISPVSFMHKPLWWLELVASSRANTIAAPDFAYRMCVERSTEAQRELLDLSSIVTAMCGAEPVNADTVESFSTAFARAGFDRRAFRPVYGLAEATLLVSGARRFTAAAVLDADPSALEQRVVQPPSGVGRRLVGCGEVALDHQVIVMDPETLEPCASSSVGELWVSGPSVARGYWNDPDRTREVFDWTTPGAPGQRFLRTGDLGFLRDGEVFITGRFKDLIIVHGRNLYPQDLERTSQAAHPATRGAACAAFGVRGESGEQVILVQEIQGRRRFDPQEVAVAVKRCIADEHDLALDGIVLVRPHTLPKTSSGKIQRVATRIMFEAGQLSSVLSWTRRQIDLASPVTHEAAPQAQVSS